MRSYLVSFAKNSLHDICCVVVIYVSVIGTIHEECSSHSCLFQMIQNLERRWYIRAVIEGKRYGVWDDASGNHSTSWQGPIILLLLLAKR